MSEFSIKQYQNEVEKIKHFGGTSKETAIRNAFYNLLNDYARQKGLMIVPEVTIKAANGKNVTPDGTLKDMLRQDWGYWESKDESDDLDEEIKKKFAKGYPKDNILFEDSQKAVLFQNGIEVQRVPTNDSEALHNIITRFINFERPEVQHFRKAIELFKQDIPKVTETLRGIIIAAEKTNQEFIKSSASFLKLCHDSINPNITNEDVREMIIQHILTEDVFNTIFDETQFHRENNIARELEKVIHTFFTGSIRKIALGAVQHYYQAINATAAGIADHHEKQKFLKVIYETFYKSYNPKAADRLGVVYTPNEIVQFMIKSTDYLLNKHFNKFLEDKGVDILDPATGTGTFICDIIDYIGKEKLPWKYKNEIHANELAILPYYISNLNIEFTYTQKMGAYSEFENLCFVDTLDNMGFTYRGKQIDMFSPFTEENTKRIKKQNDKKIAVIMGNPPYNALQLSANENNPNRKYPEIDQRIKETIIKYSTASNLTKLFDMYVRFYRWAFDRLDNNGIVAFITNRSFIDSRTFDGFRRCLQAEFSNIYIVDTKSDVRANPKIAGTTHNVFGIQTGVAIMILVKKDNKDKNQLCNIQYLCLPDEWRKEEKLQWFSDNKFESLSFTHLQPDKNNNWFSGSNNDFESLMPLMSKEAKKGKEKGALFNLYSLGINTNRDEWVYDFSKLNLLKKIKYLTETYNKNIHEEEIDYSIKWSSSLIEHRKNKKKSNFDQALIRKSSFRPFTRKFQYVEKLFNHRLTDNHYKIYGKDLNQDNIVIFFKGLGMEHYSFHCLATNTLADIQFNVNGQCLPLYRYDDEGNRNSNMTSWGINQFVKKYGKKGVTNETIFFYVYAILHSPKYREKYELNLKKEFPRIPYFENFSKWASWGKSLMDLHINYETVKPYELKRIDMLIDLKAGYSIEDIQKTRLKAIKADGIIEIDSNTTLTGIPVKAWEYKLGNRSALEWILDQYKESKPKDPTIAEKFNTYKFSDYKEQVIDLLKRVCTVSVETMNIIEEMKQEVN